MSIVAVGIDPGKNGGIAWQYPSGDQLVVVHRKIPETERDIAETFEEVSSLGKAFAYLERVSSSPGMGVVSAFSFGRGYGFLRGCLICWNIPFAEVVPAKWQKELGCLTKGDKNVSKSRAQQLFPTVGKITHATADALLLSEYCRRTHK
jgi:hypothetical protein